MNIIEIHHIQDGIPYNKAPAGSFCEILDANDKELIGMIVKKPWCINQAAVLLNQNRSSTDLALGIRRVRPLQAGDSFTVTIGG